METGQLIIFLVVGSMCLSAFVLLQLLERYVPKKEHRGPLLIKFPDGRWETVQWSDDEDELNRRILHVVGEEVPAENDPSQPQTNGQPSPVLTETASESKPTPSIQDG